MSATTPIKATRKAPFTVSWELVTPARAKVWLMNTEETEFNQRQLSNSAAEKYANEMRNGEWFEFTGDTVLLTTFGGLECVTNAKHRLNAIIKSDKPLNTLVLRNVPMEAFKHVDQGKERTLKDVLDAAKFTNSVDMQTTIKNLWKWEQTGHPLLNPAPDHMIHAGGMFDWVMAEYPDLEKWYGDHMKRIRKASRANKVPAGTMAYFFLRWSMIDRLTAYKWLTYLEDPVLQKAPCHALALASNCYRDIKIEASATTKAQMGHWADLTLACHQCYNLAWNLCAESSSVRTMAGFKNKLKALGNELPELKG